MFFSDVNVTLRDIVTSCYIDVFVRFKHLLSDYMRQDTDFVTFFFFFIASAVY